MNSNCYNALSKAMTELSNQDYSEITNEDIMNEYNKNLEIALIKHFNTTLNFNPFLAGFSSGVISQFFNN